MSTRTIRLFAIHGRAHGNLLDYDNFFSWFAGLEVGSTRVAVYDDLVFVLERGRADHGKLVLEFISGDPSEHPLIFNEATREIDRGDIAPKSWPARQTRAVVDPAKRVLALESRHTGVSAKNLERYFERAARANNYAQDLSIQFAPIATHSFEEELREYERVREATVVIRRPNFDWDDAEDPLTDLAGESNGSRAEVTIAAARGETLSTTAGIVEVIRQHATNALTSIVRARIKGTKRNDSAETTLSTEQHQVKRGVTLPRHATPEQAVESVVDGAIELIDETESADN
jgi:hypothetical protein